MDHSLEPYLEELKRYADEVWIPGLSVASEVMPLDQIFVEPELEVRGGREQESARDKSDPGQPRQRLGYRATNQAPSGPSPKTKLASSVSKSLPEPAIRALTREPRSVVLGEPGQGKSTLLRQHCLQLTANPEGRVPLLVEFRLKRDWHPGTASDFQWLHDRVPEPLMAVLKGAGWRAYVDLLQQGRGILLMDGYDELTPVARPEIRNCMSRLKENRIVLTSRPGAYHMKPLQGFKVFCLRELRLQQVAVLAERTCRALAPQFDGSDETLGYEKIMELSRGAASKMAQNPLLLSFMCLTCMKDQSEGRLDEFPSRPAPLIGECVKALVEWHRMHKEGLGWPLELVAASVDRILGALALASFQDRSGLIRETSLEKLSEEDRRNFHNHLIPARFVAEHDGGYFFPLETFREYFASCALANKPDPYAIVSSHLHDPDWQAVILLTAGKLENKHASLLDLWLPTFSRFFVGSFDSVIKILSNIPYLGKWIDAFGPPLKEPLTKWWSRSRHSTEFYIRSVWKYHCSWTRRIYELVLRRDLTLAARCLGACLEQCPNRLSDRIADRLPERVDDSALAEAAQYNRIQKRWLEQAKGFHAKWNIPKHIKAVRAMQALKVVANNPEVQDWLLDQTKSSDEMCRIFAVRALASAAADTNVSQQLLETCKSDASQFVRREALTALSQAASVPEIQEWLLEQRQGSDLLWRVEVERFLTNIAQNSVIADQLLQRILRRKSEGNSTPVSEEFSVALGSAGLNREVWREVLKLTYEEEPDWRAMAAAILTGAATEQEVCDRLLVLTSDEDWSVQISAVGALAHAVTLSPVKERLLQLTHDEDYSVQEAAALGLAGIVTEPEIQDRFLELVAQVPCSDRIVKALAPISRQPAVRTRLLLLAQGKNAPHSELDESSKTTLNWDRKLMRPRPFAVRLAAVEALAGACSEPDVQKRLRRLTWRVRSWKELGWLAVFVIPFIGLLARGISALFYSMPSGFRRQVAWLVDSSPWSPMLMWTHSFGNWTVSKLVRDRATGVFWLCLTLQVIWFFFAGVRSEQLGDTALKALRNWRGVVPRFLLWRVALLALDRPGDGAETLRALLQLHEEQRQRS